VDRLRAPVVAILDGRFAYFCSVRCKRETSAVSLPPPSVVAATRPALDLPADLSVASAKATPEASDAFFSRDPPPTTSASDLGPPLVDAASESFALEPAPPVAFEDPPVDLAHRDDPSAIAEREASPGAAEPQRARSEAHAAERTVGDDPLGRILRATAAILAIVAVVLALIDPRATVFRLSIASGALLFLLALAIRARHRGASRSLRAMIERDLAGPHLGAISAAAFTIAFSWVLFVARQAGFATAAGAGVWVVLGAAIAEWVSHTSARPTLEDARALLDQLDGEDQVARAHGEEIELRPGTRLHVDVKLLEGRIVGELWNDASVLVARGPGECLPAGVVVREGQGRGRVVATGDARAFARLLADALVRSDRAAPALRALDRIAPWAAVAVVVLAVGLGLFAQGRFGPTLAAGVVAGASILVPPARRLAVRDQLRGCVDTARRGAAFADGAAFVRASQVRSVVLCARGTLVAEGPDTCDVETIDDGLPANEVLAIAAGAERTIDTPIARAIVRTAEARDVRPIEVRAVQFEPGLGIVAEEVGPVQGSHGATSSLALQGAAAGPRDRGSIVVGGRALCLREHVPTAEQEARILELERRGREVLLVARSGRVVGLLSLSSPLRAGALAAVQRLHDLDVEPVLLGGGARERIEAIARAVDIDHVRPEILPRDRAAEIRRIAQSGGPVAVVGRPELDGPALAAADLAVVLDDAGAPADSREHARGASIVALAGDLLASASDVLVVTHATRVRVVATLAVGLVPVVAAALPVAFGLVRAPAAPLAALAATVALAVRELVAAALPEGERIDDTPGPGER
jgi:cation transport ATPase